MFCISVCLAECGSQSEILEGKGPWAKTGEYRCPREGIEAAKAGRAATIRGVGTAEQAREAAPQLFFGGVAHEEIG